MLKKKKKKFPFFPFLDRLSTNTKTLKASADKFRLVVLDFVTKTTSEEIYVSFLNNILVSTLDFILVRWRQKKKTGFDDSSDLHIQQPNNVGSHQSFFADWSTGRCFSQSRHSTAIVRFSSGPLDD